MRAEDREDEALDYSEEEPPPRTVQRGPGLRTLGLSKAVSHDESDYSDNFEDDSMQESRPSSRGASILSDRRRGSGPPSQPLTARSESRRQSQEAVHSALLSVPAAEKPGSERSETPPVSPPASGVSAYEKGRPQVPQLPLRPVPELPTPVEQWRAPLVDAPPAEVQSLPGRTSEVFGPPSKQWDITAMAGPEPKNPERQVEKPCTQAPMGDLQPHGLGGSRSVTPVGVEAQLVDQLLQRFVLEHKAPTLQRRERAAYKEMLEQVSWTALEPKAANDAALLLSKHFLAPVSANEALRAFRRSLHSILCDERVLDIVEHQMTLHFSRLGKTGEKMDHPMEP